MARADTMKASPSAAALRKAAIEWAKAAAAPVEDPEDSRCGKADRALRAATVRYADAVRAEEEAKIWEPCEW
jgi:hypothetical protein